VLGANSFRSGAIRQPELRLGDNERRLNGNALAIATAADLNGGFATNGLIQQPRSGVGNVSTDVHGVAPGDGGNGEHAVNNGLLAQFIDPATGSFTAGAGQPIECSLPDPELP
jgi:hypothetical protein